MLPGYEKLIYYRWYECIYIIVRILISELRSPQILLKQYSSLCSEYCTARLRLLWRQQIGASARIVQVSFLNHGVIVSLSCAHGHPVFRAD
jgi:hypothetical protein